MFCMDERDREPAFRKPNDRTLEHARRSGGRMIPFVRLDLAADPIGEAERCLDLGARGIKLHPRAQRFLLNDERLDPVFALAAERRVPILIHGGRGLPPIADALARLVDAHPEAQLIIAHAGIADLANLLEHFAGRAGVFFDTSVWSPIDLLDLYRHAGPEQVVYASDYPYGQQPASLFIALKTARLAGLDEDDLRNMLAGNANRIADGEPPLEPRPAEGRRDVRAADDLRAHPPVHLDGDAAPLDAPAGHDRGARARAQRVRGAERRARRGARPDQGAAARRRATSGACCRSSTTRASSARRAARRSGSSTSPTSWR